MNKVHIFKYQSDCFSTFAITSSFQTHTKINTQLATSTLIIRYLYRKVSRDKYVQISPRIELVTIADEMHPPINPIIQNQTSITIPTYSTTAESERLFPHSKH